MHKLSIFDGGELVATITTIDANIFIFARSSREWSEMRRLVRSGFEVGPQDPSFLEHVASRAHNYNFSTELLNE
jgi:hypothetical protein